MYKRQSFLGTWMTFAPWEKELLAGFVVNKFRGDPDLLAPAPSYMRNRTGKPVLGVIPMMRDINIPEEDRSLIHIWIQMIKNGFSVCGQGPAVRQARNGTEGFRMKPHEGKPHEMCIRDRRIPTLH